MKSVISRGFISGREYYTFSYDGKFYMKYSEQAILDLYRSLP